MKLSILLLFATALATGLMAGVFFWFLSFVMKALGRLPAPEGIHAMQSINVLAERSGFLVAFLGTALACLVLAIHSARHLGSSASQFVLAGAIAYLLGSFLVTAVFNVPMNNALAAISATDPAGATYWTGYQRDWTLWNHVRTVACLVSSGLFTASLVFPARA